MQHQVSGLFPEPAYQQLYQRYASIIQSFSTDLQLSLLLRASTMSDRVYKDMMDNLPPLDLSNPASFTDACDEQIELMESKYLAPGELAVEFWRNLLILPELEELPQIRGRVKARVEAYKAEAEEDTRAGEEEEEEGAEEEQANQDVQSRPLKFKVPMRPGLRESASTSRKDNRKHVRSSPFLPDPKRGRFGASDAGMSDDDILGNFQLFPDEGSDLSSPPSVLDEALQTGEPSQSERPDQSEEFSQTEEPSQIEEPSQSDVTLRLGTSSQTPIRPSLTSDNSPSPETAMRSARRSRQDRSSSSDNDEGTELSGTRSADGKTKRPRKREKLSAEMGHGALVGTIDALSITNKTKRTAAPGVDEPNRSDASEPDVGETDAGEPDAGNSRVDDSRTDNPNTDAALTLVVTTRRKPSDKPIAFGSKFSFMIWLSGEWKEIEVLPEATEDEIRANFKYSIEGTGKTRKGARGKVWKTFVGNLYSHKDKCAAQQVVHKKITFPVGEACQWCLKQHRVCAIMTEIGSEVKFGIYPVPEKVRFGATEMDTGFWITPDWYKPEKVDEDQ